MESKKILLWAAMAALFSHNFVIPVMSQASFQDQKNYYTPDPNTKTPPTPTGSHATPTPSHGHATPTPTPTPSHGGSPPTNCGTPPTGANHHHHTPSPPSGGSSGGYHHSPPTSTPSTPTPTIVTPPTHTPPTTVPSPPFAFDPNSPPFNCTYWRNHPTLVWGLIGWWGTVGSAFGISSSPASGAHMNMLQALSNTRTDGLGELYREGSAALLNCLAHTRFPYTSTQVRDAFVAALSSDKAAAAQARLFKLANEGRRT